MADLRIRPKKQKVTITELEPGRYKVERGRYSVTFEVDNYFKISLFEDPASIHIKDYHFAHSDPNVLLQLGSLMKHAAGHAMLLKNRALQARE